MPGTGINVEGALEYLRYITAMDLNDVKNQEKNFFNYCQIPNSGLRNRIKRYFLRRELRDNIDYRVFRLRQHIWAVKAVCKELIGEHGERWTVSDKELLWSEAFLCITKLNVSVEKLGVLTLKFKPHRYYGVLTDLESNIFRLELFKDYPLSKSMLSLY